ncbi:hypothetical protein HNR46_001322 [Haloferula luteola]|uniref:Uncharacterized protein n=1 Tax=Haloferula luteola TaxID=595692 RepID=A0A840V8N8_9BACT|nr:hypothetical protein [Haloferula luteola]MBB5351088.1 hypothetical protein [Haloferula luteola]
MIEPIFYITLADGREVAVTFTTRQRTSAATFDESPPTIPDVVEAVRIMKGGLLTDSRITTHSPLEKFLIH